MSRNPIQPFVTAILHRKLLLLLMAACAHRTAPNTDKHTHSRVCPQMRKKEKREATMH